MFKVSCFYQKVHNFLLCRSTTVKVGILLIITFKTFHAIIIDLHVLHSIHVAMLMYMHVSCINFERFPCMLHAYYGNLK